MQAGSGVGDPRWFLEELFNLSPKAEGGLEAGGFIGFDDRGPCIRLGVDVKDIEVSLEISALGGWISFTLGPVPIIPTEDWAKKIAGWMEEKLGTRSLGVEEGQFRFPPLPKKATPKLDPAKAVTKAKAGV